MMNEIKLNDEIIKAKFYGSNFKLNLYGALYTDGNFAIQIYDEDMDLFSTLSINVPKLRETGQVKPNELIIDHDLIGHEYLDKILEVLTDEEPRQVEYGFVKSIAIVLKDEIIDKLLEIDFE